jgi:hypothetical protein
MRLATTLLLLCGCPSPSPLCLTSTAPTTDMLLVELGRTRACEGPVEVQEVILRRASDNTIRWRFKCTKDIKLSSFVYGVIPPGCIGEAAPALVAGEELVIDVEDVYGADGELKVTPR